MNESEREALREAAENLCRFAGRFSAGDIDVDRSDLQVAIDEVRDALSPGPEPVADHCHRWAGPEPVARFDGPDCAVNGCAREVGHIGDHRADPAPRILGAFYR